MIVMTMATTTHSPVWQYPWLGSKRTCPIGAATAILLLMAVLCLSICQNESSSSFCCRCRCRCCSTHSKTVSSVKRLFLMSFVVLRRRSRRGGREKKPARWLVFFFFFSVPRPLLRTAFDGTAHKLFFFRSPGFNQRLLSFCLNQLKHGCVVISHAPGPVCNYSTWKSETTPLRQRACCPTHQHHQQQQQQQRRHNGDSNVSIIANLIIITFFFLIRTNGVHDKYGH